MPRDQRPKTAAKYQLSPGGLGSAGATDSGELTFGHPKVLAFLKWAADKGVEQGARRAIALAGSTENPLLLGAVAGFISRGPVIQQLRNWIPDLPAIRPLVQLGEVLWAPAAHPPVLPRVDPGERVDRSLRGALRMAQLAGLCAARLPPGHDGALPWLDALRCWAFAIAASYLEDGNQHDRRVATFSTYLRKALDDADQHRMLQWFIGLQRAPDTVNAVGEALQHGIRESEKRVLEDVPSALVTAIRALARREQAPESNEPLVQIPLEPLEVVEEPPPILDTGGGATMTTDGDDTNAAAVDGKADAERSTAEESEVRARGILLDSIEDLQWLPFSWRSPRALELRDLVCAIDSGLKDPQQEVRVAAAIASVALLTGNTAETVLTLPLVPSEDGEWRLDLANALLVRDPPRRTVRWRADQDSAGWIVPLATSWQIVLRPAVVAPLTSAASLANARHLADLWSPVSPRPLEQVFNRLCRNHPRLARLTSGFLKRAARLPLYELTGDHAFTRLAFSTSRTGLPGACAYPAYVGEAAEACWRKLPVNIWIKSVNCGPSTNAAGSELDPLDDALAIVVRSLCEVVEQRAMPGSDWPDHHNALTLYVVLALLAATGGRPVSSPFERADWIDWHAGSIYIEDKETGAGGRVVPLVPGLVRLLSDAYVPHLRSLAHGLERSAPAFAAELMKLADRKAASVPFFFFLKASPALDWIEVSESSVAALELLSWPLPLNLMRHRLSTRLRELAIDPEIIDGLLAHLEPGCETWGHYSTRSWKADRELLMPALEAAYDRLDFRIPRLHYEHKRALHLPVDRDMVVGERSFGIRARTRQRELAHKKAEDEAQREIDAALQGRGFGDLTRAEIDALYIKMALTAKDMPHPYAVLRYAVLDKQVRSHASNRFRTLLGRRAAFAAPHQSIFSPACIGVSARLETLRQALDASIPKDMRLNQHILGTLAALDLCLTSRVTNTKILHAAVQCKDIDLLILGETHWVEFRHDARTYPDQPALRFPVSERSARWLSAALSKKRYRAGEIDTTATMLQLLPAGQRALVQIAGHTTVSSALDECARLVDAANAIELPGFIAGYLAGRVQSVGLPIVDAIRAVRGRAPASAVQLTDPETSRSFEGISAQAEAAAARGARSSAVAARIEAANDLLSRLRNRLQAYADTNPRGAEDTDVRRNVRRDIARLARTADAAVPSIATYLTLWVVDLLDKRPGKPKFLKPSSIQRYLTALSPRFVSLAHDVDLAELDTDDLTELYATITEDMGDDGGQDYVCERLREFHAFAQKRFGLEDPDWSELSGESPAVSGAPGVILEPEYVFAMRELVPHVDSASRDDLNAAALLLFGYRFGLRGKEAWGLKRDDWIEEAGTSVVLVRSNALRALKRPASQRQVPLLMHLTEFELGILERWKSTRNALTPSPGSSAGNFLFVSGDGAIASLRSLRTRVNRALRAATLASHTTLHHARHTFANVAFLALVPSPTPPVGGIEVLDSGHVRRLLLGDERSTRRTTWALARLLGHAHPRTTFKSYVHVLAERTAQTLNATLGASFHCERTYAGRNLDTIPLDSSYLKRVTPFHVVPPRRPTLVDLVNAARLLSIGQTPTAIAHALNVEERVIDQLKQALGDATKRLERTPRGPLDRVREGAGRRAAKEPSTLTQTMRATAATEPLERRILVKNWKGMLDIAESAKRPVAVPQAPEPATLIGASLQLLMWEEVHFQSVAAFLDSLDLRADTVVYESKALPAQMRTWAERSGFSDRLDPMQEDATRRFQLDGVIDVSTGQRFLQRCAVVRQRAGRLNSNAELLLLWTCFLVFVRRDH